MDSVKIDEELYIFLLKVAMGGVEIRLNNETGYCPKDRDAWCDNQKVTDLWLAAAVKGLTGYKESPTFNHPEPLYLYDEGKKRLWPT